MNGQHGAGPEEEESSAGLRTADQHLLMQSSFKTVRPDRAGGRGSGGARGVRGAPEVSTTTRTASASAAAARVRGRSGLSERGMATTAWASCERWGELPSMRGGRVLLRERAAQTRR